MLGCTDTDVQLFCTRTRPIVRYNKKLILFPKEGDFLFGRKKSCFKNSMYIIFCYILQHASESVKTFQINLRGVQINY